MKPPQLTDHGIAEFVECVAACLHEAQQRIDDPEPRRRASLQRTLEECAGVHRSQRSPRCLSDADEQTLLYLVGQTVRTLDKLS